MRSRAELLAVVGFVLLLDQATKILVGLTLSPGEFVPVVPGLVHLTLVRNTGMAFGLLSAATIPYKPVLVTLLSVLALSAVVVYAFNAPASERFSQFGLALILGGALGNIVDRVRLGYVVDFIDVFFRSSHWPAFNVADASICVGVGFLLLDTLRRREQGKAAGTAGAVHR
ncbi:MAG: signal peptidase II [Acidobacteriota bacterium]